MEYYIHGTAYEAFGRKVSFFKSTAGSYPCFRKVEPSSPVYPHPPSHGRNRIITGESLFIYFSFLACEEPFNIRLIMPNILINLYVESVNALALDQHAGPDMASSALNTFQDQVSCQMP